MDAVGTVHDVIDRDKRIGYWEKGLVRLSSIILPMVGIVNPEHTVDLFDFIDIFAAKQC